MPALTFMARGIFGGGWLSAFYIFIFGLPTMFVCQALAWLLSVLAARRSGVRRMNDVMTWSYLVYIVCAILFPFCLTDFDDTDVPVGSALTAIGLPEGVAAAVSSGMFVIGAISGLVALCASPAAASPQGETAPTPTGAAPQGPAACG